MTHTHADAGMLSKLKQMRETTGCFPLQVTLIDVTGSDRATFLHQLCTNDVKGMSPGDGREAFFCNVQGKVIAYVRILCLADRLRIETVPHQAERLLAHLDKYLIREDVQLVDRSHDVTELLVFGAAADGLLGPLALNVPDRPLAVGRATLNDRDAVLVRRPLGSSPAWLLQVAEEDVEAVTAWLIAAGAVPGDGELYEIVRIESGLPNYGCDVTERNLPQEIGRDKEAISFTKGCYLGQETVARIDALGHVNWQLVRIEIAGPQVPAAETEVMCENHPVGRITSAIWSPRSDGPLAFALLRREQAAGKGDLTVDGQPARICHDGAV